MLQPGDGLFIPIVINKILASALHSSQSASRIVCGQGYFHTIASGATDDGSSRVVGAGINFPIICAAAEYTAAAKTCERNFAYVQGCH